MLYLAKPSGMQRALTLDSKDNTLSTKHVLSYGGGVNSTALMVVLLREGYPLDEVVFADTGAERPETYNYLRTAQLFLKKHYLTLRVLRSKNGSLLDTCRNRKVIPSMVWRWSTRD